MREDLQRFVDEEFEIGTQSRQFTTVIDASAQGFDSEQRFLFLNSVQRWNHYHRCVKVRDYVVVFRGDRGSAAQFLDFLRDELVRLSCDGLRMSIRSLVRDLELVFRWGETPLCTPDRMLN